MAKRSERSLVLVSLFFVFFCLLLSGGSRLIGRDAEESAVPVNRIAAAEAVISGVPAPQAETGLSQRGEHAAQRYETAAAPAGQMFNRRAQCDANGNVLTEKTYLRAVYQAFVLGDGFV